MRSYREFLTTPWFSFKYCENITTPCWIPQASNMIDSISSELSTCSNLKEYTCMLATIKAAKYATKTQCPKSCKSESYEVLTRSADIEPFTRVGLWEFGGPRVKKVITPRPSINLNLCTYFNSRMARPITMIFYVVKI